MRFTGGLPETACGAGSTLRLTGSVRAWLPELLRRRGFFGRLLDAPCGDFNWMARTDLSSVHYVGVDFDWEHCILAMARRSDPEKFSPRAKTVMCCDLMGDNPLPHTDAMLCREFLQHLPTALVMRLIDKFKASEIPLLLVTSHDNSINSDIGEAGWFRPLNLCEPPFSWPAPIEYVEDEPGSGRILGLWSRSDL